jgi:CubicO group peptidase (beta-lactamase class C family)
MRWLARLIRSALLLVLLFVVAIGGWLFLSPPELLRVGDGYAAKIVCSNAFIAGRDPQLALAEDVQAPGNPLLRLIRVSVDRGSGIVTARILGLFAPNYALYREGLGCTTVPDGDLAAARAAASIDTNRAVAAATPGAPWPDGDQITADGAVSRLVADPSLSGPGMRAVIVVKAGRIIAEAYGDGFNKDVPLLGWSMTKTVNAAIVGRLIYGGRLSLADRDLLPQWYGDVRARISLADLLGMESGLAFDEDYGAVTDVTRMLYLEPDMAGMAASSPQQAPAGKRFHYSTGTGLLLSRIWMNCFTDQRQALAFPREALFSPLRMSSAVLEPDEHGTFVGGSYLYATARDWARFAQFLLQDGVWHGERLLPTDFMTAMRTPSEASEGSYTKAQAWSHGPGGSAGELGLPMDSFWMLGHDGQSIAIVPSAGVVLVRLGLTPDRLGYRPQKLLKEILNTRPPAATLVRTGGIVQEGRTHQ